MTEAAHRLRDRCNEAYGSGIDIPTIWRDIVLPSGLAAGRLTHQADRRGIALVMPLITGQRMLYLEGRFLIE